MAILVWAIFILYCLLLVFMLARWHRLTRAKPFNAFVKSISVVIPVRNEAHTITALLTDLSKQTHIPAEVILVNDHSTDNTVQVVQHWMHQHNPFSLRIIELANDEYGKKKAIAAAVAQAKGEVIVTTDADCRVGEDWLLAMASRFSDEGIKLVAGSVRLKSESFFGDMLQLEQTALTGISASFISVGVAVMCTGANLAYRTEVFNEVSGYKGNEHVASGDDEFLLKKIAARYPRGIAFNADPRSLVTTTPVSSAAELLNQRVRWAGKWRQQLGVSSLLAIYIFMFHLTVLSLPVLAMLWVVSLGTVSLLVLIKLFLELLLLIRISKWMNTPFNVHAFAALQFLYTPYVVFFALISNGLKANWKGRKI